MTPPTSNILKTHHDTSELQYVENFTKIQLLTSGVSFWVVPSSGGKRAPRWRLEGHFELFWNLLAKRFPDGPWSLIFSIPGYGCKTDPRRSLEAYFELFRALVAKGLPDAREESNRYTDRDAHVIKKRAGWRPALQMIQEAWNDKSLNDMTREDSKRYTDRDAHVITKKKSWPKASSTNDWTSMKWQ